MILFEFYLYADIFDVLVISEPNDKCLLDVVYATNDGDSLIKRNIHMSGLSTLSKFDKENVDQVLKDAQEKYKQELKFNLL